MLKSALAVGAVVVYTIWDEALLSTPVVAAATLVGPWPAFVFFVLLYGSAGLGITLLVVRAYRRRLAGAPGRLERWVEKEAAAGRYRWARRLLLDSGWPGFAVASWALGPIATIWLLVAAGRLKGDVRRAAVASSAVFAVTFVAPYCGIGALLRAV